MASARRRRIRVQVLALGTAAGGARAAFKREDGAHLLAAEAHARCHGLQMPGKDCRNAPLCARERCALAADGPVESVGFKCNILIASIV